MNSVKLEKTQPGIKNTSANLEGGYIRQTFKERCYSGNSE